MLADAYTLDTTYRLQIRTGDGWSDYSQAEYTDATEVHRMASQMYGGLKPDEYRLIEITRTVVGAEKPAAPAEPTGTDALAELRAEFAAWHADGASSNDSEQFLDDFLTERGQPTVLYAPKSTPAGEGEFLKHICNDGAGPYFGRLQPDTCVRCAERQREREQGVPAREPGPRLQATIDKKRLAEQRSRDIKEHFAPGGGHEQCKARSITPTCFDW